MAEKEKQTYSFRCENNSLTINGVSKVIEISEREAQLKLQGDVLVVKGDGLNLARLDKEQGVVAMDYSRLSSLSFKGGGAGLKGLFR